MSPSLCDWAFLVVRAVIGLSALYIGVHLAVAFVRNGLSHRRKRWLIGWQSIFFTGVGVDALMRMRSRTESLFAEEPLNFTTWPYWLVGILIAIGSVGTLLVWMKLPSARLRKPGERL